jgi:hypothetical protein
VVDPGTVVVVVVDVEVVDVTFLIVVVVVFFTVVISFAGAGRRTTGRWVLTANPTCECHRTRVPGAGDWCRTTTHVPAVLPIPEVAKNNCALRIAP